MQFVRRKKDVFPVPHSVRILFGLDQIGKQIVQTWIIQHAPVRCLLGKRLAWWISMGILCKIDNGGKQSSQDTSYPPQWATNICYRSWNGHQILCRVTWTLRFWMTFACGSPVHWTKLGSKSIRHRLFYTSHKASILAFKVPKW